MLSAGHSNSSAIDVETSLNNSPVQAEGFSPNNVAIETTFQVANTNNATAAGQSHSNHLDLSRGHAEGQRAQSNDDSFLGNDTQSQNDVADRWIALLRKTTNDKKRKSQHWKDDVPSLKSPKANPAPKFGLAGALFLTALGPDKRRKRQKTQDQEEPPATTSHEPQNVIPQPDTRPISQEQLVAEVKGIYAGLVMVEAKCIEVDNKHATLAAPGSPLTTLNNEQWQALTALHQTLLHEHHDFFLASQHPSASVGLRMLASKYAMPARMWRHGIHDFLELLRHRLPASLDHMIAFICLAYSMVALLYETIPMFEDTWIECLGDLGRYRMAIEDDDIRDREVWTGVAKHWYAKASDKAPTTGRLYHHLAILARPNALQQLFYYSKSLCVAKPFTSARESILTLFNPVLDVDSAHGQLRIPPLDMAFVKAHGLLFTNKSLDGFERPYHEFIGLLDNQIGRLTPNFMEQGYHIAITNTVAMLGFGSNDNPLMTAIKPSLEYPGAFEDLPWNNRSFQAARKMANATLEIVLQRLGDPNVLPCVHVSLAFMHCISCHPHTKHFIQVDFPWKSIAEFLNNLLDIYDTSHGAIERDTFLHVEWAKARPLPEDFAMRGLLWTEEYFPSEWFSIDIGDDSKETNLDLMTTQRKERILWLAARIAKGFPSCLKYEPASYNPLHTDFNKARFSTLLRSSSFDHSSIPIETSQSSPKLEASSTSYSLAELERSISPRSPEGDLLLNGINATLSLPIDALEDFRGHSFNVSQPSSEDRSYFTKPCPESLESWLSDLVNLDIASDGSKEIEEVRTETEPESCVTGVAVELMPYFRGVVSTDLLALAQTGDSLDGGRDLDHSLRSNQENDDQEQQAPREKEMQCVYSLPEILNSNELSYTTPPTPLQGDERSPSESLTKVPGHTPPFNFSATTSSGLLPSLEASSSPSSPKPHTCPHCNKAFARVSDMK